MKSNKQEIEEDLYEWEPKDWECKEIGNAKESGC